MKQTTEMVLGIIALVLQLVVMVLGVSIIDFIGNRFRSTATTITVCVKEKSKDVWIFPFCARYFIDTSYFRRNTNTVGFIHYLRYQVFSLATKN